MDRNTDFSFMTAGIGNTFTNTLSDVDVINIEALVLTFTENAIKSSEIYVKHANRDIITKKDLKMSMKYEVFMFMKRDNINTFEKIKKEISDDYYLLDGSDYESDFD